MNLRTIVMAWIAPWFLLPSSAIADAHATVSASILPMGPSLGEDCYMGGSYTPQCGSFTAEVSTGTVQIPGLRPYLAATRIDMETAQIRGYAMAGARTAGSTATAGANVNGYFNDNVTMHLAPGASWPQTFVVRATVKGTASSPYYACCNSNVRFGTVLDEAHWWDGSVDVTYERTVEVTQETTYAVYANLYLHRRYSGPGTLDFSTQPDSGIHFEVDLPPGLTMTSDSGVLMTQPLQNPGIVLPDPSPAPGGGFRFRDAPAPRGIPARRGWDPPIVTGYEYEVTAGGFALVSLPIGIGDDLYDLYVFDPDLEDFVFVETLAGGVVHYFDGSVTRFQVRGIEPGARLSPDDPTAFVTDLAFLSDEPFDMFMRPLSGAEIPLGPWPILVGGGAALTIAAGFALRRSSPRR